MRRRNLPVPPNPLHWSATRAGRGAWWCVGGTSRFPQTPSTGPLRGRTLRVGPKKFAEPVSLSSTASADLPLPGTALRSGFVLLALRARRKQHTNASSKPVKGSKKDVSAICGNFFFQRFHSLSYNVWKRLWRRILEHEHEQCGSACEQAIRGERRQPVRLEVAHQEPHRRPGRDA